MTPSPSMRRSRSDHMIAALPHQATKTRFLDNEVRAGIGGEQFGISADWLLRGRGRMLRRVIRLGSV
ncbi:hypothetical protein GCM10011371_28080 [Novosphingobium marinum]|nr:hypothetical protein GCM10011371_28080 [Novosphingobium marinum]